jgi:hypothetical protein
MSESSAADHVRILLMAEEFLITDPGEVGPATRPLCMGRSRGPDRHPDRRRVLPAQHRRACCRSFIRSEELDPTFLVACRVMGALIRGYRDKQGTLSCLAMFCSGLICFVVRREVRWTSSLVERVFATAAGS